MNLLNYRSLDTRISQMAKSSVRVSRDLALALVMVFVLVACRLTIDTPNFQPIMAAALFAGYCFRNPWMGVAAVSLAMVVTDIRLGGYEWQVMATVYAALALPIVAGRWIRTNPACRRPGSATLMAGLWSLAAAFLFYAATNLAIWIWTDWYPASVEGLAACMLAGLAFFRWTVASNLVFTILAVGGWELGRAFMGVRMRRRQRVPLTRSEP